MRVAWLVEIAREMTFLDLGYRLHKVHKRRGARDAAGRELRAVGEVPLLPLFAKVSRRQAMRGLNEH